MKNLCFIGTSHLASVATAWNNQFHIKYPKIRATFFTGPRQSLHQAEFLHNQVRASQGSYLANFFQRSDKKTVIELAEYDCFIFHGLDYLMTPILELADLLTDNTPDQEAFFSTACLGSALESIDDLVKLSAINKYCVYIRQCNEAPIIVSISPKTSILALHKHPEKYKNFLQHADAFEQRFIAAQQQLLTYPHLTIVPQPQQTLATPYFTKFEYSAKVTEPPDTITDYRHKNSQYGVAVLTEIFKHPSLTDSNKTFNTRTLKVDLFDKILKQFKQLR